jgi:hypothetical protein
MRILSILASCSLLIAIFAFISFFSLALSHPSDVHAQYDPPPPPPSPPAPSPPANTPPGPFGHVSEIGSCPFPNQPKATIRWTASQYATSYTIFYLDEAVGTMQPPAGITIGNVTSYDLNSTHGLIAGHNYGFVVRANNSYGSAFTNLAPYSPTSPGGWSHPLYGWMLFPTCTPPGQFTYSAAPAPLCTGVDGSAIDVNWNTSAGASSYMVYPQSNIRGWIPPAGLAPTSVTGSGGYLRHTLPTPIPANEGWEYTVWATNANGSTQVSNSSGVASSTYYIYGGWTNAYNCSNPVVDLLIDGADIIKTINSGDTVNLNYWVNNAYNITTSATPSVSGVTTNWTALYPSNNANPTPWSLTGVRSVTLYNNTTYPYNSYQFTITANNNKLSGPPSASKTVTVNVYPEKAPFIQTTQGDVHSNSNINVPQ